MSSSDMQEAIAAVKAGRAQRICAPAKWRVWREGDRVRFEVFGA